MTPWLAVWRVLARCVTFGPDCAGKALCVAVMRSVWTWGRNSVGEGDGIESVILTEFPRVSAVATPFAAGHGPGRFPPIPWGGATSDVTPWLVSVLVTAGPGKGGRMCHAPGR